MCVMLGSNLCRRAGTILGTSHVPDAHRLLDKSQLVRRKALQALDALCKHAPQSDSSLHAVLAARSLLHAALSNLLAILLAPPASTLASDGAWQVRKGKAQFSILPLRHLAWLGSNPSSHGKAVGQYECVSSRT